MDKLRGGRVSTWIVVLIAFMSFSASTGVSQTRRPKNVEVSLRAKWPGTPLLLEAWELISGEWNDLFWDFAELWLDIHRGSECSTSKCCVEKILSDGRSLMSEQLGTIFEFSLTLRSASPRLVLYRQLAEDSLASFPSENAYHASCCWVDTGNKLLFNVTELLAWLDDSSKFEIDSSEWPETFDFDHVYLGSSISSPVSILYGALGTNCFKEFHVILAEASKERKVKYVVRPVLLSGCQGVGNCDVVGALSDLSLGGYGVELALKNMEYKTMDDSMTNKGGTLEDSRSDDLSREISGFLFSKILERKPDLYTNVMAFRDYLLSSTVSDTLEIWELKDLGHQTVQRVVHASDPLQSLQEINQNFPSVVSSLSRMKLDESIKDEIISNQRMVPPGKSLMALNGALINIDDIDIYQLINLLHEELTLADQFENFKIPQNIILKLLSVPPPRGSHGFRLDFRSHFVHYLNNLEVDPIYKRWRSNINEILMPVFPGQMRYVRKNLFHAVYIFDPSTICGAQSIDTILSMYRSSVPMRFGILLYSSKLLKVIEEQGGKLPSPSSVEISSNQFEDDVSILIIRLFLYIKENYDGQLAFQFLSNLHKLWGSLEDYSEDSPEPHLVEEAFVEVLLSKAKSPPQDVLLQFHKESSYISDAEESSLFVFKLGISELHCCLLMNGRLVNEPTEDASINAMNEELPRIQEQVYYGHITSNTDVLEKFLSESGYKRYNALILGESKDKKTFVSLFKAYLRKQSLLKEINYLHTPGTADQLKPITHLLTVNVSSRKGLKLLHEGIQYLVEGSSRARVGIIFHVDERGSPASLFFIKAFQKSLSLFGHKEKFLDFLGELCSSYLSHYARPIVLDSQTMRLFIDEACELAAAYALPSKEYRDVLSDISVDDMRQDLDKTIYGELGLIPGENAVITNGRVIIPMKGMPFLKDDFSLVESVEYEQRTKHILEIVEEVQWAGLDPDELTSKFYSDLVMLVSSALSTRERSPERARFEILHAEHSAVVLHNENSSIHIDVVIDPLSASGQRLSPLLHMAWKCVQPSMRIVLNPVSSLVDLPLKNYYRFVMPTRDDFSAVDSSVDGPKAFFPNMPASKTLTMNLDVPESWLIEPIVAIHDLDNILLENIGEVRTLQAVFELEALLLTGHCSEKDHDPPRGLQLILGTRRQPHLVDTIVMANLGYWQMKVSPGVWYLELAPGRSSELYTLKKSGDQNQNDDSSKRVVINDLTGKLMLLEVKKKRGKEHEELLTTTDDIYTQEEKKENNNWNSNLLKWASGLIGGNGVTKKTNGTNLENRRGRRGKVINIFSIASGHLYERFLKIMILSVLKNTHRPVKFWFIKNYLSPQFKDFIPHMATEYGFEYELITYKWPTWLHKQKEKQRIIWAYKILFLDVIFPLSLEKVIFVDADQIVRADMGELYDMDIKGRPLAYTPFCDNNKDMDGYRFWRQGFWKDHLRGKPYHISALYVVDLVKFRQTAAGDTLRVYYETLSKDPNSLSNLDQDLPNYAQHTVPIFSLPQEWLWCESWCGNATKSRAKTIDLCNNPMTKEPKLQGAKRIVSEWNDLDAEARAVTARIFGEVEDQNHPANAILEGPTGSTEEDEVRDRESRSEL